MSILEAMFVTLFNSYCFVCLSKGFFQLLQQEKTSFFKLNNCQKFSQLLAQSNGVAILLANTKKSLKFNRFESAQNLVSFTDLNFLFVFGIFCCRGWHCFHLFLNFEQNEPRVLGNCSYKKCIDFFVNWRCSVFLYQSKQQMVPNAIRAFFLAV